MQKSFILSVLIGTTSLSFLSATASSAQTIPVISGTVNLVVTTVSSCNSCFSGFTTSNLLTPLGIVNINSDGFNGILKPLTPDTFNPTTVSVTASQLASVGKILEDGTILFNFVGTTNGTSTSGQFINATTNINFSVLTTGYSGFDPTPSTGIYAATVTNGSITLPPTDSLQIRPDLIISYSVLQSPDSLRSEYRQKYSQDFSISSFNGGRILELEDK